MNELYGNSSDRMAADSSFPKIWNSTIEKIKTQICDVEQDPENSLTPFFIGGTKLLYKI